MREARHQIKKTSGGLQCKTAAFRSTRSTAAVVKYVGFTIAVFRVLQKCNDVCNNSYRKECKNSKKKGCKGKLLDKRKDNKKGYRKSSIRKSCNYKRSACRERRSAGLCRTGMGLMRALHGHCRLPLFPWFGVIIHENGEFCNSLWLKISRIFLCFFVRYAQKQAKFSIFETENTVLYAWFAGVKELFCRKNFRQIAF